jgi:hypothetical protein
MPNNTFLGVLTGTDQFSQPDPLKAAIAVRLTALIPAIKQKEGDYCYDGNRCKPENLGWRFQQEIGHPSLDEVKAGKWDDEVEWTYHHAANAEHYYRFQKDWG